MKKILFTMLLISQIAFSQKSVYTTIEGYFPSVDLNKSNVLSQQLRIGLGHSFAENIGASFDIGCGLLGNNSIPTFGTQLYYSFGISANYMFLNLKNDYKIGVEALTDYNILFTNNDDHLSLNGALKLELPTKTYFKIGLQNRYMKNNATSLICVFGFKIK